VLIFLQWVFAYVGPETAMPLTSLLATLAALVLLFGKNLCRLVAFHFRKKGLLRRAGPEGNRALPHARAAKARKPEIQNGGRRK
jgi:hypothetical protein